MFDFFSANSPSSTKELQRGWDTNTTPMQKVTWIIILRRPLSRNAWTKIIRMWLCGDTARLFKLPRRSPRLAVERYWHHLKNSASKQCQKNLVNKLQNSPLAASRGWYSSAESRFLIQSRNSIMAQKRKAVHAVTIKKTESRVKSRVEKVGMFHDSGSI